MIDQRNGFNISMLNQGYMRLFLSLTKETLELIPTLSNETMTNFTWNVTYFVGKFMFIDVYFDEPLIFS